MVCSNSVLLLFHGVLVLSRDTISMSHCRQIGTQLTVHGSLRILLSARTLIMCMHCRCVIHLSVADFLKFLEGKTPPLPPKPATTFVVPPEAVAHLAEKISFFAVEDWEKMGGQSTQGPERRERSPALRGRYLQEDGGGTLARGAVTRTADNVWVRSVCLS